MFFAILVQFAGGDGNDSILARAYLEYAQHIQGFAFLALAFQHQFIPAIAQIIGLLDVRITLECRGLACKAFIYRANEVRRSLQAVVDFADVHGCAVIGITHFAKGGAGKAPQDRVIGSQAFGALARMVLVTAKEEGSNRRVMARAKSNIAPDDGGVAYSLELATIAGGIEATHAVWAGIIEGTAREILGDVEHDDSGDGGEKLDAEQFLRDLLADGPVSTKQVKADAAGAGYAWRTIERAKRDLGIEAAKAGMKEGWQWALSKTAKNPEDRHEN